VSSQTPKKKKSGSNEKQFVVIAVPVVEEARLLLMSTGLGWRQRRLGSKAKNSRR
jgi:hypothetical protein